MIWYVQNYEELRDTLLLHFLPKKLYIRRMKIDFLEDLINLFNWFGENHENLTNIELTKKIKEIDLDVIIDFTGEPTN